MAAYDLLGAIDTLFPGVVVQNNLIDAAFARFQAKGAPLDSSDVTGILTAANSLDQGGASYVPTTPAKYGTALPTYPTGLKRFPDSNEARDGWSIVNAGAAVEG